MTGPVFRGGRAISARRDRVVLIATLIVFGALSAWLLPDGWRPASLPPALICATIARRYVAGRTARKHGGDDGSHDQQWTSHDH
ncbi:hypothetical protein [Streptomyces sp. NBC_01451]|uniref:hypothetical protein n=1 Tax=Streptomyces sp. NBC_01451 TaxID=2903872 RepID=UPI002E35E7EC|nr:hypothetical protein [Streptomyces sp. NBC_01451]